MRQSDGSEILGPNDPRNLVIGIIYISPNDDRQSVVNAITAQDQKGRDQIVLVLPAQNKSFKNAVDFAGLHQMAGELEATIVLVAPGKSKIANLARRESFTVYPTLEELTSAEFPPLDPDGVPVLPGEPAEDDAMEGTMMFPVDLPGTSAPAPAPAVQNASSASPKPIVFAQKEEAPAASAPVVPLMPPAPPAVPVAPAVEEEDEHTTSPSLPGPPESGAEPPEAVPEAEEEETAAGPSPAQPETRDMPGTWGTQGTWGAPRSYLPAVVPPNSGVLVPANQLPMYYEPLEPSRRRSWKGWIIAGVTVVVLIGLGVLFYRPILDLFFPPTATVTIVPRSQQVQQTYQIMAVLGVPDPTKSQVDARALYADSQTQTQTVKATGKGHIAGQQAHGILTFYNASNSQQTIAAGTIVFDPNGLAVVDEQTVTLPALDTQTGLDAVSVLAHTVNVGSAQDIAAYDFNSQLCCGGTVYVTNTEPFTGGENRQDFTYVQQSDIDGVVQNVGAAQARQAQQALQGQVRPTEKPAGQPRCAPQVTSNHRAGEQANDVTVNVTTSCVDEVYDMQAVQVLAARKLAQDAATNPGPAYAQVGTILVQVAQAVPDARGNVLLVTRAGGVWAYQFTNAQRAHLASLIAGKSEQHARSILLTQTGVQAATITLTGVGVTTVPSNLNRITIAIEAVQGLHP